MSLGQLRSYGNKMTDISKEPLLGNDSINTNYDTIATLASTTAIAPDDVTNRKQAKRAIMRNLIVLAVSFLLVYTSFAAIQNLQSTVNKNAGLGTTALACFYTSCVVASLFVPVFLKLFGCKGCVLSGFIAYGAYSVTNFYPRFYTLIPVALLQGIFTIPIGAAQGIYVTDLAVQYARITSEPLSVVISRFNGIFFFFWQNTQIWGNGISSIVLHQKPIRSGHNKSESSFTLQCGFEYCDGQSDGSSLRPPSNQIMYTLYGILLAMITLGCVLTVMFVNRVKCDVTTLSINRACVETFQTHRDATTLLLIPLYFWTGYNLAFLSSEYTKAFVGCPFGISMIGYVMMTFGVGNASAAFLAGKFEPIIGRVTLFTFATLCNVTCLVAMVLLDPVQGHEVFVFVMAFTWGLSDGIWQATTSAMIGIVFHDRQSGAFSVYRMWQSLGLALCFVLSSTVHCTNTKILTAIACCVVQALLYIVAEFKMLSLNE